MWPFNTEPSREERIDNCNHEWEEKVYEGTYPDIKWDDSEEIYAVKTTETLTHCPKCGAGKERNVTAKKLYFKVDRVEEVDSVP